ncbi:hypothetical protein KSC_063370 [Ktedonobacter sp. SOSP1-52]|uniref:BglII/BstYI family type II restriction endonuclease n=1 Tax=Ktedonobacter sp. SOSP1-52 TaxID=2778366 RepID=UPI001915FCD7|nr:BglII/BstYI family type II restriction endonuclease [Ktedonobacter sp. SOSP1-52]GHO67445.1 hypothetical protein KSC_063370 [Ktedonobacter sp. SOSP1-52]
MRIAATFSINEGKDRIAQSRQNELLEIQKAISEINAEECKKKMSKEKGREGKLLYSPRLINEAFEAQLEARGWERCLMKGGFSITHYVEGYKPLTPEGRPGKSPSREIDFAKNLLGLEVQFGPYDSFGYNIFLKMPLFAAQKKITCGVIIIPVKAFAREMSTGVTNFEQCIWDLENRGLSSVDIPILIIGIDADSDMN